jgi:hypothetical protein
MDALGGADRTWCLLFTLRGLSRAVATLLHPSMRLEGFY